MPLPPMDERVEDRLNRPCFRGVNSILHKHGNTDLDGQITTVSVSLPMPSKKIAAASPNSESVKKVFETASLLAYTRRKESGETWFVNLFNDWFK